MFDWVVKLEYLHKSTVYRRKYWLQARVVYLSVVPFKEYLLRVTISHYHWLKVYQKVYLAHTIATFLCHFCDIFRINFCTLVVAFPNLSYNIYFCSIEGMHCVCSLILCVILNKIQCFSAGTVSTYFCWELWKLNQRPWLRKPSFWESAQESICLERAPSGDSSYYRATTNVDATTAACTAVASMGKASLKRAAWIFCEKTCCYLRGSAVYHVSEGRFSRT